MPDDDIFWKNMQGAAEKFGEVGPLGVTEEDHRKLGSSPPPELADNPGKTMLDLMSEDELLEWLRTKKATLEEYRIKDGDFAQSYYVSLKRNVIATLTFLRKFERLPKEFEDYTVD